VATHGGIYPDVKGKGKGI
jgi:Rnl2 family RNA ligase